MLVASKSANAKQTIGGDSCMNSNAIAYDNLYHKILLFLLPT